MPRHLEPRITCISREPALPRAVRVRRPHSVVWLLLGVVVALAACSAPSTAATATDTPTRIADPRARIHGISPGSSALFVRITFTGSTTYDQAVAIVESGPRGESPDPWGCDDPRSPTPPPLAERESVYDGPHTLLIEYPSWDELLWIAASPRVVSVDAAAVYQCP